MRTPEERKEWERLCRQYNVDSLYEAIEGCREELEFLVHCAERLEPLPDDDTPALRPRRATNADHADYHLPAAPCLSARNAVL